MEKNDGETPHYSPPQPESTFFSNEKLLSMVPLLGTSGSSAAVPPPPQDVLIPSRLGLQLDLDCLGCQGDQEIPEEHKKRG